jgi:hypothetical protein
MVCNFLRRIGEMNGYRYYCDYEYCRVYGFRQEITKSGRLNKKKHPIRCFTDGCKFPENERRIGKELEVLMQRNEDRRLLNELCRTSQFLVADWLEENGYWSMGQAIRRKFYYWEAISGVIVACQPVQPSIRIKSRKWRTVIELIDYKGEKREETVMRKGDRVTFSLNGATHTVDTLKYAKQVIISDYLHRESNW